MTTLFTIIVVLFGWFGWVSCSYKAFTHHWPWEAPSPATTKPDSKVVHHPRAVELKKTKA